MKHELALATLHSVTLFPTSVVLRNKLMLGGRGREGRVR